uniref:Reverse transcriptase domain-containing protein n=1 Tax=Cuerna arida TaxID=1464854 RepID=A0A1B6GU29_9HEMI
MPDQLQGNCHTVMYADDTVLTISDKTIETLQRNTNAYLNLTKQYCSSNDLVLNEKKPYKLILLQKISTHNTLHLENNTSRHERNNKVSRHHNHSKLTWKPHIDQLCKKLSSGTYVIRRTLQVDGLDMAKVAYFALFESHLRYGIVAWGGNSINNLERALVQQT